MKLLIFLTAIFILTVSADKCSSDKSQPNKYKAKLEIKALCMNYTFTLKEGKLDTSLVNASWIDETTNRSYANAFSFVNPCDFPQTIKEGEEFWFVIDSTTKGKECAVCLAYYPTPPKKIWIKVVEQ